MLQLVTTALTLPACLALAVLGPFAPVGLAVLLFAVAYMGHPVVAGVLAAPLFCAALAALYYARKSGHAIASSPE
jgi:hypothetical protein